MTKFWRDGFYRTNAYGTTSWVRGHSVVRDDWDRDGYTGHRERYAQSFNDWKVTEALASRYIVPNAKCPVCGQLVFFYQNAFGSKVYFEDLGPPWLKHPCTDGSSAIASAKAGGLFEVIEPPVRSAKETRAISLAIFEAGELIGHSDKRGPEVAVHIVGKYKIPGACLLVLEGYGTYFVPPRWFCKFARVPKVFDENPFLWLNRRTKSLTAFDVKSLQPKSLHYTPIKGPNVFVDELVRHNKT
jgi:hypothetical protein